MIIFYTLIDSLEGIGVVHAPGLPEVIYQILALLSPPVSVECLPSERAGDLLHLLVLKCLPEIVRDVEHHSLQEQHEGNPLVVGVNSPVILISCFRPDSLVRSVHSVNSFILG